MSILKHKKWFDKKSFHVAWKQYYLQYSSAAKTANTHAEVLESGIDEKESLFRGGFAYFGEAFSRAVLTDEN